MNQFRLFLYLTLISIFWLGCNPANKPRKLTIAVASNMQFSTEEIVERFTENSGIPCDLVVGSSGKLTAQIMEGAPFDLLLSADMKYPQRLYANGYAQSPPKIYAYGKLVLYSTTKGVLPSLDMLGQDSIAHIALANPKTAPYGMAAMEVLEHHGLTDLVRDKLVYGENVSQTNQFMTTGAAQMGFTAKSTLMTTPLAMEGRWIALDSTSYTPIKQGMVVLKNEDSANDAALLFFNFIFSDEAQKILKKYGYSMHE